MIRIAGIVLLVVGLIGLAVGTFQYTRTKRVLDAGPIRIDHKAKETVSIPRSQPEVSPPSAWP